MEMFICRRQKNSWKKHYYRFGLSKKTYYIIRRSAPNAGLFSFFNTNLGHMYYALQKGYIPVVDMMNYKNPYLEDDKVGKENAWEYYFEQPCQASLEEAYGAKRVILSQGDPIEPRPDDDMGFFTDRDGRMSKWREFTHKYIHLKKNIYNDIEEEWNGLVKEGDKVLGVMVRGTDYVAEKPYGHPVQPDVLDVIQKAGEIMQDYRCNKIFVGTEDRAIAEAFQAEFGDSYITNRRSYIEYSGDKRTPECRIDRENDYFLQGKEYLTQMVMLSKADCFIGGRTSGTVGLMLMSGGV